MISEDDFLQQLRAALVDPPEKSSESTIQPPADLLDGGRRTEVKLGLRGMRDLRAAILELVAGVASPDDEAVLLIAEVRQVRIGRVQDEWVRFLPALREEVRAKLALIAFASDGVYASPEGEPQLEQILRAAKRVVADVRRTVKPVSSPGMAWSPRRLRIWEVLLDAWLRGEQALQIQELGRRAHSSHPTVAETIHQLELAGEVERLSSRRVSFRDMPRRSWAQITALLDGLRKTERFIDSSGRAPDPNALLERARRVAPEGVAVGGVAAAREYMPEFDLNGLPRVDLSVSGVDVPELVRALNPGLLPAPIDNRAPVLVIHHVAGLRSDFVRTRGGAPFAPLAETLLDLEELGLVGQSRTFVDYMRKRNARG